MGNLKENKSDGAPESTKGTIPPAESPGKPPWHVPTKKLRGTGESWQRALTLVIKAGALGALLLGAAILLLMVLNGIPLTTKRIAFGPWLGFAVAGGFSLVIVLLRRRDRSTSADLRVALISGLVWTFLMSILYRLMFGPGSGSGWTSWLPGIRILFIVFFVSLVLGFGGVYLRIQADKEFRQEWDDGDELARFVDHRNESNGEDRRANGNKRTRE